MASNLKYSGLRKMSLEIPPYSMGTFDYMTNPPNYFRLQNRGDSTVYCSTGNIPTEKVYDFIVGGTKTKMYAQPNYSNKLFVFNPSGSPVEVVCVSFSAEFDPLTLAFSEIEISMPDSIESNQVISGFNASLPTGNNHIGSVDVVGLATLSTMAKQNEIISLLQDILSALTNAEGVSY